jgi:hypothetical protein
VSPEQTRVPTRDRRSLRGGVAVVLVSVIAVAACGAGGDGAERSGAGLVVDELVAPEPGAAMLPSLDSAALADLVVETVRPPEDLEAERIEAARHDSAGQVVLYGDAEADDPFERPWALAIRHQGSENSELGQLPSGDEGLSYIDVPVDQLTQETLRAGVLSSGVARPQDLAGGLVVDVDDGGAGSVEIGADVREAAPERLEPITSGPLDLGLLGLAHADAANTPLVTWRSRPDAVAYRTLTVSSYAADPALELLLRATMGGATAGPQALVVSWSSGEASSAVRTVGDTTVLVQGLSVPEEQLVALVESLRPATPEDWIVLREAATRDRPRFMPEAEEYLSGELPGGRWELALDLDSGTADWGAFQTCNLGQSITFLDGAFGGGGSTGGQCPARGMVGVQPIYDTDVALLGGYLSSDLERLVVTLDDGSVVEPELVGSGSPWRLFGTVLQGSRRAVSAEVFDGAGTRVADLLNPDPAETQEQFERLSEFFEQQAAQG